VGQNNLDWAMNFLMTQGDRYVTGLERTPAASPMVGAMQTPGGGLGGMGGGEGKVLFEDPGDFDLGPALQEALSASMGIVSGHSGAGGAGGGGRGGRGDAAGLPPPGQLSLASVGGGGDEGGVADDAVLADVLGDSEQNEAELLIADMGDSSQEAVSDMSYMTPMYLYIIQRCKS
jgi:hypothetical protein